MKNSLLRMSRSLFALAIFLICAGAMYQAIGHWRDARRFPQRGKSFQVGRVKLNLNCSGQGSPSVVLDSGLGGTALDWIRVQPAIARFTRVCSYDRAGYGWSEPSPQPRTSWNIASDLHSLLTAAKEQGPYILVGHSFGGYNVRVYTGRYPTEVAGMVLVDASHPDEAAQDLSLLSAAQRVRQKQNQNRRAMLSRIIDPLRHYLGIDRLKLAAGGGDPRYYSKEIREEFLYLEQQGKYLEVVNSEDDLFDQSGLQAKAAGNLGDRPSIVLTAGRPYDPDPLLTEEQMKRRDDLWINVLQVEEANLSTRGKQIVVPDSSHEMPEERPDAIISAIHDIWSATQR